MTETDQTPRPEPGWLETPAGQVFCWYHPPQGNERQMAVLLCDPLGSDRMNLHLAYRHLALALSEQGYPVLRLDYTGTCDSEGSPRDPNRLSAILQALHAGADYLSDRTGISELTLFGTRIGGTIAACFAQERMSVHNVVLWGAYASGRQFLRAETAFERMMASNPDGRRPSNWQQGDLEAAGFLYSGETVEALRSLKLEPLRPDVKVLLIDWDDIGDSGSVAEAIDSGHDQISRAGLLNRGSESVHRQRVPEDLIAKAIQWLNDRSPVHSSKANRTSPLSLAPEVEMRAGESHKVRERCLYMGSDGELFGILSTSADTDAAQPGTAILLVNGGNNHRPGINRNYTEWARSWAASGFAVLRMDIRGLGDSPPLQPPDLNRLYMNRTVNDVREAAQWLKGSGYERIVLCGYCAGAYQALQYARQAPDIDALMLIELLRYYHWEPLQNVKHPLHARLLRYWARFHPMWLLDRGRIGHWLKSLTGRGIQTLVVYRKDERMLKRYEREVQKQQSELAQSNNYELSLLSSSNHILSPLFAQEELSATLKDFLERHQLAGPRTS